MNQSSSKQANDDERQARTINKLNHMPSRELPSDFPKLIPTAPAEAKLIRATSPNSDQPGSAYRASYQTTESIQSVYDYYVSAIKASDQLTIQSDRITERSANISATQNSQPDTTLTISIKDKRGVTQIDIRL